MISFNEINLVLICAHFSVHTTGKESELHLAVGVFLCRLFQC